VGTFEQPPLLLCTLDYSQEFWIFYKSHALLIPEVHQLKKKMRENCVESCFALFIVTCTVELIIDDGKLMGSVTKVLLKS
jgi:hypothetical protein